MIRPKREGPIEFRALRLAVRSFYDIQNLRIAYLLRLKDLQRRGILSEDAAERHYGVSFEYLEKAEADLGATIAWMISDHPVAEWGMSVRGIGPTLMGAFLAEIGADCQARLATPPELPFSPQTWITHPDRIPKPRKARNGDEEEKEKEPVGIHARIKKLWDQEDHGGIQVLEERHGIECFPTVSALWAFSGLHVVPDPEIVGKFEAPRRKKGQRSNWNPFLRTLAYKMASSWIKTGGYFRKVYDEEKARQQARSPVPPKWLADLRARRRCSKLFFALAWEFWRNYEGLSTRPPYAIEHLGHTSRVRPEDIVEPNNSSETKKASEPIVPIETRILSEPLPATATPLPCEPSGTIETRFSSEPPAPFET